MNAAPNALRLRPSDVAWEQFQDPHGRPTTPVRILKADDPYVLEADFPPGFRAGLHWHPHDTIYVITAGSLQFGDEGWFRPGDVRWVRGGHAYGPELAGPEGVRFHLVSLGGPIGLNWADLYEVPGDLRRRLEGFPVTCGRLHVDAGDTVPWPFGPVAGVRATALSASHPHVHRLRLAPGATLAPHAYAVDTLAFVRGGRLDVDGEGGYETGDLRWSRGGATYGRGVAGAAGADVLLLGLGGRPL